MCLLSVFVVPLLLESLNSSLIDMFSKSFIKVEKLKIKEFVISAESFFSVKNSSEISEAFSDK